MTSPNLLCPLVKEEYDICYFMKMTSSDIQRTVLYCIGDYHKCEIYRRKVTLNSET